MIDKIKAPKLRISESVQFFSDVLAVCKNSNPADLNIQKPWTALDNSLKLLGQSFKKEQASVFTAELIALDQRRDHGIICLRKLADGYTNHHVVEKQQAARKLLIVIDKYGRNISKMNYQAETSVLENLVNDLKSNADNAAAVKLLGLDDTVTEIKAANDMFNSTYLDRVSDEASKDLTAAGALVQECRQHYNMLVKHIEANAILNPSEVYEALISKLNNLIEKFNTLLALRGARNSNETVETPA